MEISILIYSGHVIIIWYLYKKIFFTITIGLLSVSGNIYVHSPLGLSTSINLNEVECQVPVVGTLTGIT